MDNAEQQRIENLGVISVAIQKKIEKAQAKGYLEGYKSALLQYAWWKDGTQYVGSCGTTLAKALAVADRTLGEGSTNEEETKA